MLPADGEKVLPAVPCPAANVIYVVPFCRIGRKNENRTQCRMKTVYDLMRHHTALAAR